MLSVTPSDASPGPSMLTATGASSEVLLAWSSVAGATAYTVQRSTVSGGPYQAVATVAGTEYTDTGLTNGTTYYYVVSGLPGPTLDSPQAQATPDTPGPADLVATPGDAVITLSWGAVTPLTNYVLSRSNSNAGPWSSIATPTVTSYSDTAVTNGTTYYYTVSAASAGGTSADSNIASATPALPPNIPFGLSATPGNAQVSLIWSPVGDASGFNVYRSTVTGGPYTNIGSVPDNVAYSVQVTTYTDTSVANGATYYYVVTSVNAGGESGYSNEVNATPEAAPSAPTDLTATAGNSMVQLQWTDVPATAVRFI